MKTICSGCSQPCQVKKESGKFDAAGRTGTIKGNLGDVEVSDCCGDPVEEIDPDLFEYWEELKKLAEEKDVEWLVSDYPESHREAFEDGISAEDELDNQINAAMMSM